MSGAEVHRVGAQDSFVLLHRPAPGAARETAVLMCPPFGWEEMCSYRARQTWAQALAQAGYACARLDLPGTGDSPGGPDERTLSDWTEAVAAAAAWLADATGAARVAGLGLGLGGLVMALAAQEGAGIDELILWGVPRRGRAALRAARALAAVIAARYPQDARDGEPAGGDLDLIGFRLPAATAAAIEATTLAPARLAGAGVRRALLLGRDGAAPDAQLAEGLRGAGVEVSEADGDEYALMLGHPQQAVAPAATIARSLAWLQEAGAPPGLPAGVPATLAAVHRARTPQAESEIHFDGAASGAFGLLTREAGARGDGLVAVWLNAGALHHIGPNRAWVQVARRWASRGVPSVRVDLPDLGEAQGQAPRPRSDASFYGPERIQQTLAVLDGLARAGVGERFVLGGLCSGAYWALHAALADPRVRGLMLINLYAIVYSEALVTERDTAQSLDALGSRAWRKLVRGQLSAAQIASGLRSISPARVRRGATHPVQRAQGAEIEAILDCLRARHTEITLVLSEGEGLHDQLARLGVLDRAAGRWPNLVFEPMATRDHMLRAPWAQRAMHDALDRGLARVLPLARAA